MGTGFYIGDVYIPGVLCLGPMAGVTDFTYRKLCREQGCKLVCTEMVSAKALFYNNKNTDALIKTDGSEAPLAVQIFGSDPDILTDMALRLEEGPYDIIDFNMGCPVPKIVKNNEGSALMLDEKLVEKIISTMCKKLSKPLTVKIRKGFDNAHVNAVEIAKILEACGVAAIAVHGRTREQFYSGKADWDIIRQVKEAVSIPVIGNGDITTPHKAVQLMQQSGCDGIMLARAAQGNPWIFREIEHFVEYGTECDRPSVTDIKDMILRHTKLLMGEIGEYLAIRQMRKHIAWYTAGLRKSSKLRLMVNQVEYYSELKELIGEWHEALTI